ncbi:MAG: type II secretion system F family protein [Sedimentisphaerales bacterium]|jgi:tight adherence protein B
METERVINIIIMVSIFGLILSVWCICIFLWLGQYLIRLKSVQKRLGIVKKESEETHTLKLWRENKRDTGIALPGKPTLAERLEVLKNSAGWTLPAHTVILRVIGASFLAFILTYLVKGSMLIALIVAASIVIAFWTYTKMSIAKQAALFERQLVDALGICARALRAGLPLLGSFQLISEEIDKPVGDIFFRICHEQLLGLDMKESIRKVARNVYNPEMKLFATAVAIQLQSGGNLADLMDSLASVIRARMRLNRRVRVLTSQTQLSKRILIAIPMILFLLLNIISPQYMEVFYSTTTGKIMLAAMASMVLFGVWVMNRIAVLRF